jgi:prepilin-type processing-associated H-X9-DG protein
VNNLKQIKLALEEYANHHGGREGFDAAFADGSVRFLEQSIHESVLKALVTRNGGETISIDAY